MLRPPTLRTLGAGLVIAASLGVAACGSGSATTATTDAADTAQRAASPSKADGTCPEATPSYTLGQPGSNDGMFVVNRLPSRVDLRVPLTSINCADWSGVSTPYTGLNGKTLDAGVERAIRLEHRSTQAPWTLEMAAPGTDPSVRGSVRFKMTKGNRRTTYQYLTPSAPVPNRRHCTYARVADAPAGWRDTAPDTYSNPQDQYARVEQDVFTLVVIDGAVSVVNCGPYTR